MDVEEFLKQVKPAGRRSRLAPWWADISKLRRAGCTLEQVKVFLATNGVEITVPGLSTYIQRRSRQPETMEHMTPAQTTSPVADTRMKTPTAEARAFAASTGPVSGESAKIQTAEQIATDPRYEHLDAAARREIHTAQFEQTDAEKATADTARIKRFIKKGPPK